MKRVLLASLLFACGPVEETGQASARILSGTPDETDTSVVAILVASANGPQFDSICSGTVVSPHAVLTAAHCFSPDVVGPIDHVQIFLGDDAGDPNELSDPANLVDVAETDPNPSFDVNAGTNDVAVVVAAATLPPTPMPMSHDSLGSGDVGAPVHAVGYGESVDGDDLSGGVRRSADTTIFSVDDEHLSLDDVICFGDSGGPTFATKNGALTVVGVHSGGTSNSCVGIGEDTRVDLYASSFVDPIVNRVDPGFLPPDGCNESGGSGDAWLVALALGLRAIARPWPTRPRSSKPRSATSRSSSTPTRCPSPPATS